MPVLVPPKLSVVHVDQQTGKKKYAISFVYDFTGDDNTDQSLGGIFCPGSVYSLSLSSLNLPVEFTSFADFRSLQFSQEFDNSDATSGPDGPLIINTPGTNQTTLFGGPVTELTGGTEGEQIGIVSGAMPIFLGTQAIINFLKGANGRTPTSPLPPFGQLAVTLYNFDISSWMHSGFMFIASGGV